MRKQLGCGQQRGGQQLAAGAGNAGEVVAAGREDVRRSFPGAASRPRFFQPTICRGFGFSLHKEFRAAEIRFYLHKEFRAAEI